MLNLDEIEFWRELESPYGNSEEIPFLIQKLLKTKSKETANELIWEYIYHQGSVYENTIAAFPHLVDLIKNCKLGHFKMDLILSLGIVLLGFDDCLLNDFFHDDTFSAEIKTRIKDSFHESVKTFRLLVDESSLGLEFLDENEKRNFLITHLVTGMKHKEAEVFLCFSGNDEYMFVCPSCEAESFLWNEDNVLNSYDRDPVFNENKTKIDIENLNLSNELDWLEKLVDDFDVASLKPMMPFFKGQLRCHACSKSSGVFEGIKNSIN